MVTQACDHPDAVEHAHRSEHVERRPPAPMLGHETGKVTAQYYTYIISCLVDRHRRGSRLVVVLGQKRVVRRAEERLSAARGETSHHDQHNEPVAQAGEHRGDAPEQDRPGDYPFLAEFVTYVPSDRHEQSVKQIEYGRDGADGHIAQPKVIPDHRQDDVKDLPVRLVEKVRHP